MSVHRITKNEKGDPPAPAGMTDEMLDLIEIERDCLIAMLRARERILLKYGRIRRPTLQPRLKP